MDIDGSGMIVNGTAQSYTVSSDGLTYTFKLREGLCWQGLSSSETVSLTAYDYEYAFRRIYDPQTHSPHTERFSDIKNSMAVYGGAMSSSQLGVKAVDELTLEITLEYPDCEFLKLMAHPAASPCNEQLFLPLVEDMVWRQMPHMPAEHFTSPTGTMTLTGTIIISLLKKYQQIPLTATKPTPI